MSAPALSVVEALPPRVGDIPAMLRKLADEIEAGEHPELTAVHAVLDHDDCQLQIRMFGRMSGPYDSIGAFQTAIAMLTKSRLEAAGE